MHAPDAERGQRHGQPAGLLVLVGAELDHAEVGQGLQGPGQHGGLVRAGRTRACGSGAGGARAGGVGGRGRSQQPSGAPGARGGGVGVEQALHPDRAADRVQRGGEPVQVVRVEHDLERAVPGGEDLLGVAGLQDARARRLRAALLGHHAGGHRDPPGGVHLARGQLQVGCGRGRVWQQHAARGQPAAGLGPAGQVPRGPQQRRYPGGMGKFLSGGQPDRGQPGSVVPAATRGGAGTDRVIRCRAGLGQAAARTRGSSGVGHLSNPKASSGIVRSAQRGLHIPGPGILPIYQGWSVG